MTTVMITVYIQVYIVSQYDHTLSAHNRVSNIIICFRSYYPNSEIPPYDAHIAS